MNDDRGQGAPRSSLPDLLDGKRLVVLVGEGGVGKTSVSASLAYRRAQMGERVAVLTIDPAPRLGDALGLAEMDGQPREVPLNADASAAGGSLTAMRLDSRRTFDRMVERHAPDPATAQALLAHPLYKAVAGQLGGTENFMAFQRLHELLDSGDQDGLVLDTPPAANAADLLSAPERLSGLLATGALSVLADPSRVFLRGRPSKAGEDGAPASTIGAAVSRTAAIVASAGEAAARAGLAVLLSAIERVTGSALRREVAEFAGLFGELAGGLERRSREIDAMLRDAATAFVLVTRPRSGDVDRALAFRAGLEAMGIRVAAVVVNRVTPPPSPTALHGETDRPSRLSEAVARMDADMQALRDTERVALQRLREGLMVLKGSAGPVLYVVEEAEQDVASLDDVAGLARALARTSGERPIRRSVPPIL